MSITRKELNPIWVPPSWHYVEIARKRGLRLVDMSNAPLNALAPRPGRSRSRTERSTFPLSAARSGSNRLQRTRRISSASTAPARTTSHSPVSSKRRRSTTVDGVPGQRAGVDHEVPAARRMSSGPRPRARRASGAPARFAELPCRTGRETPRSAGHRSPPATRTPSPPGPAPAGNGRADWAAAASPHRGANAPSARACALRARAARPAQSATVEEHDRARLAHRPALQRVEPLRPPRGRRGRTRARTRCPRR